MAITRRIAIASDYEQTREQRIKQNRDRFQKLGIVDLCLKLKPKHTPKPFKSPSLDPTQPRRRSSRLQNPPPVSKRSRGIVLEEGANPEFYTEEHDGLVVKKGSAKVGMPAEDPNKPKRPSSAFFFFMEDFRFQYQQKHPNIKLLSIVMKAAGVKWRSMSDAEKAPYVEILEKRKSDYEKNMSAYKKRLAEGSQDERKDESEKSRSEANDEDDNDDSGKAGGPQDERKDESDKSKSEVNDEDDDDDSGKAEGPQDERKDESDKSRSEVNYDNGDDDSEKAEGPQDEQNNESDKSRSGVNDKDDSGKVAKAAGKTLKSMLDAETAPCIQKVGKRKADNEKNMSAYKKNLAEGHGWLPFSPPHLETNTAALEYEQTRKQRIKQNHERFEKLGILDLSLQLKPRRTPKPSNHRITPSLGPTQPRRQSFRLQNPPPVQKRSRDIELEEGTEPAEDPNKPKRPLSPFFLFMEDFRVQYQQKHPDNKSVAAVGKAGGEKWRSMSAAEKAPYVEEVEKRKADYEKIMSAYKKRLAEGSQDQREGEADKSKSEVNDEDVDPNSGKAEGFQDEREDEADKSKSEVNDEDAAYNSGKEDDDDE